MPSAPPRLVASPTPECDDCYNEDVQSDLQLQQGKR